MSARTGAAARGAVASPSAGARPTVAARGASSPAAYARRTWPEAALTVTAAACLVVIALQGFVVDPALQGCLPLWLAASAALQLPLYAAQAPGCSRRGQALWACLAVAVAVAAIAVGFATSTGDDPLLDDESSHVAPALVAVVAGLAVWLLSRRMGGLLALAIASLFTCGFIEYAYGGGLVAASLGLGCCLVALVPVRRYARDVALAQTLARPAFGRVALQGVGVAALACALGVAVWAGVVAPLHPGHVDVRLFTTYRSHETVEVSSPVRTVYQEDPTQTTTTVTDEQVRGNQQTQVTGDDPALAELGDFIDDARQQSGVTSDYSFDVTQDGVYLYTLSTPARWWLLLLAVPVLVALAAVLARRGVRRARDRRLRRLDGPAQVRGIYADALRTLGRVGLGRAPTQTAREFADDARERLDDFTARLPDASFDELSGAYELVAYGGMAPDDDLLDACWRLRSGLPACVRARVGRLRYALRYFWVV
ncbi:DUF4129 domain-containing protein [bacterium]|nr:DUF4129 domain-containing protein [bacterium]